MSILSKPYFHDETAAYAHLEAIIWNGNPSCPHCGGLDKIYELKGASTRIGLKKCGHCRKQFTVKVGTVFESSHIPLHKWLKAADLTPILEANIAREAMVMTDEAGQYKNLNRTFAGHGFTRHGQGEYVSKVDSSVHTNTIEGFFSIFKRGMKGVYQHCGKQHLHRYLAEFDFRYNERKVSDVERSETALKGIVGKRLMYNPVNS